MRNVTDKFVEKSLFYIGEERTNGWHK